MTSSVRKLASEIIASVEPPAVMRTGMTGVHHLAAADGTRIAWRTRAARVGEPRRPSFLLTNGLSTTDEFWGPLAGVLTADHEVVDWWYRGHGESESSRSGDYAIATHADDLRRVAEAAQGVGGRGEPPVHVAFSMGVTVVLELYRVRPDLVGAMVLVAGGADHPYASSRVLGAAVVRRAVRSALRAAAPLVPGRSTLTTKLMASPLLYTLARSIGAIGAAAPRPAVERFFRAVGTMDLRAYFGTLRSLMDARASDVLPRVGVPVLVVAPGRDVMALRGDLTALRDSIPGAQWMELPDTSHAILLEAGVAIADRIRAFCASAPSQ
jgi:pimeloyl-ACP methyl ester carboxylesterase